MYTQNTKITITLTDCTPEYGIWEVVTTEGKRISEIKWMVGRRDEDPIYSYGYRNLYDAISEMHREQKQYDEETREAEEGGEKV